MHTTFCAWLNTISKSILSALLRTMFVWSSMLLSKSEESAPMMEKVSISVLSSLQLLYLKITFTVFVRPRMLLFKNLNLYFTLWESYVRAVEGETPSFDIIMSISFYLGTAMMFSTSWFLKKKKPDSPPPALKAVRRMAWSWYQSIPGFWRLGYLFTL